MLIPIERRGREPVSTQIAVYLRRAIEAGRLGPGAKLEPIRVLAKGLGVNRETVAAAYRELERLGLTRSLVGSGTFVLDPSGPTPNDVATPAAAEPEFEPVLARTLEAARASAVARIDYAAPAGAVRFERLVPDRSLYPHDEFRRTLQRALAQGGAALYDYGEPRGDLALRRSLVERMARSGIESDAEDVVVTAGATQGFAIAARLFCDAGDAVVVESPTYPWSFTALAGLDLRSVPVPMTPEGMDLERLDAALGRGGVRLIYTIPTFHNPTGISTSLAHRKRLLEIAGRHGVPVLEDDFEHDLRIRGRGVPALRALDRRGLVLYMGTFSKTLFPATRIGWLLAPRRVVGAAVLVKRSLDLTTSPLIQAGLALFLREQRYEHHLRRVLPELERRIDAAERAFARFLPEGSTLAPVEGGFLLWVTLPDGLDTMALLSDAKRAGVVYAPGEIFHADARASASLRISLAHTPVEEIERGARLLGQVASAALAAKHGRARGARPLEAVHV